MIIDHTGFRLFDLDGIAQIDDTAVRHDIKEHMSGFHRQHQRTELHLVQRIMGNALLENHLRVEFSGAGQDHLPRLHPESGCHALQPCQSGFLIADVPAALPEFHGTCGHQFDDLRFLSTIVLASLDGQHDFLFHLQVNYYLLSDLPQHLKHLYL